MKPKEGFVITGPNKSFLMHVKSSKDSMVNHLMRIWSCDKKEAISGSGIGADTSLGMLAEAASSYSS